MSPATPTDHKSGLRRLGVLGGTFDPPHIGHMLMAQYALEALALEEIIFVPSGRPPHKDMGAVTPSEHRLNMVRLATAYNPQFSVDDLELNARENTYTINTIQALRAQRPDAELFFLIGADSLTELSSWKRIDELLPLCRFIVFARPGECMDEMRQRASKLPPPWATQLVQDIQTGHEINVSSTKVRQRVSRKQSIRYLVPVEVEAYITQHGLYRT